MLQRPDQMGGRFSRKARTPSRMSADAEAVRRAFDVASQPSSSSEPATSLRAARQACTETGALEQICAARSRAPASA